MATDRGPDDPARAAGHVDADAALLDEIRTALESGTLPSAALSSEAVFALERERLFERSWVFLAHASEVPDPGDYVIRHLLDDEFIVVRTTDGDIRVHENACCHQGNELCRADAGNTLNFRCSYHGWTYDATGQLRGVPFVEEAYGESFDRDRWHLHAPAQVDRYAGMVFVNLDPAAPPLEEYLGDFAWYLDFYVDRADGGMEVRGPQRQVMAANWKTIMVNSITDTYHAYISHRSAAEAGTLDTQAYGAEEGDTHWDPSKSAQVAVGPGGVNVRPENTFRFAPESVQAAIDRHLADDQRALLDEMGPPGPGALLPNLTFNNHMAIPDPDERVPNTYIRQVRPLAPDRTEVLTWFVLEAAAPESYKQASYESGVLAFGTSGMVTQDDIVNWQGSTKLSRGAVAAGRGLNYDMGMGTEPVAGFIGPGTVYPTSLRENNGHYFYERWLEALTADEGEGGA